jgi:tetratricopeptide (TPR) repeat protein
MTFGGYVRHTPAGLQAPRGPLWKEKPMIADEQSHTDSLRALKAQAQAYAAEGHPAEAERQLLRTLDARERVLGPEHRQTLASVYELAALYGALSRFSEAQPYYERALEGFERVAGPDHVDTLTIAGSMAILYGVRPTARH